MFLRTVSVSDVTVKMTDLAQETALSFRKKIEVSKLLDRLGVSVIEIGPLSRGREDPLLVKSIASAVTDASIAVPVDINDADSVERTWESVRSARRPRLQVCVPASTVQMEYSYHVKPDALLSCVSDYVSACRRLCDDVELIVGDFTRSEPAFLKKLVCTAASAGAAQITLRDAAGDMLQDEFVQKLSSVKSILPDGVRMGVWCSNELHFAESYAVSAVMAGADEIKAVSYGSSTVNVKRFSNILNQMSDKLHVSSALKHTEAERISSYIKLLCTGKSNATVSGLSGIRDEINEWRLTSSDTYETIQNVVKKLGYDLSSDDSDKVYKAFEGIASRNESVSVRELEALIATVAYQAPPTYVLDNFIVTSCNMMSSSCHIRIKKGEEVLESMCMGDGPVDAAFRSMENLLEKHYELDDFGIRSVTEGREALGSAMVKLRHEGKLYSGMGTSTDIVASSIMAYLSAVNKIAYEEGAES